MAREPAPTCCANAWAPPRPAYVLVRTTVQIQVLRLPCGAPGQGLKHQHPGPMTITLVEMERPPAGFVLAANGVWWEPGPAPSLEG